MNSAKSCQSWTDGAKFHRSAWLISCSVLLCVPVHEKQLECWHSRDSTVKHYSRADLTAMSSRVSAIWADAADEHAAETELAALICEESARREATKDVRLIVTLAQLTDAFQVQSCLDTWQDDESERMAIATGRSRRAAHGVLFNEYVANCAAALTRADWTSACCSSATPPKTWHLCAAPTGHSATAAARWCSRLWGSAATGTRASRWTSASGI